MKKILIVITKAEVGGAQAFVINLAKALKQNNVDIIVGFGEGDFLKNELEKINIPHKIFKTLKRTKNPFSNLRFIFELKKFTENEKIDIVHFNSSNSLFGAIGAKLAKNKPPHLLCKNQSRCGGKPKTVFTFHGLSVLDPNYKSFFILKILYWLVFKFLLMFIDKSVFVSKNNLEYAKKKGLVKNGEVIYNGLDLKDSDFIDKDEARIFLESKIGTNLENKFIIGSIGRLAYPKNYEFLISTFPDILKIKPDAICIIIGEGPEHISLQLLTNSLQLQNKIFLIGEIKDAYRYLKAFDVFVLPSIYEGLSISLIETVFAKVPSLATNVGGNSEILSEKNVYQINNKKEFIQKLRNITLGDENKSKEFSAEKMANKYLKIYKDDQKN